MSYSIIVVTWQCADYLAGLVDSMNRHLRDGPQLIVVDNASTDDARAAAARWRGDTTFIALDENIGFGRANNLGLGYAIHEAIILLNPDTELVDDSLSSLAARALELNAVVGPRVLNPDGSKQPSASGSPLGLWPWVNAVVPAALMPSVLKRRTEPWRLERGTQVAWLSGSCIAAPAGVLYDLGPFDPRLHLYSEDLDLGLRAARAGIPSFFCPDVATIVHVGDGSSARRFPDRGRRLAITNRRRVVASAYGRQAERRAWLAHRLNLRLRVVSKIALGRDARRERAELLAGARRS